MKSARGQAGVAATGVTPAGAAERGVGLWRAVAEVAWKEVRVEWRSRYALSASVLFAVVTLVAITVSLGPTAARGEAAAL